MLSEEMMRSQCVLVQCRLALLHLRLDVRIGGPVVTKRDEKDKRDTFFVTRMNKVERFCSSFVSFRTMSNREVDRRVCLGVLV